MSLQIKTKKLHLKTKGAGELIDISEKISGILKSSKLQEGHMTVFVVGQTAAVTTLEYEPGLKKDIAAFYERIAPQKTEYAHHQTWGDDNGHSHIRSAVQGPDITIPFVDGCLQLGRWQQVIFVDFDTRPRERTVIVQLTGTNA